MAEISKEELRERLSQAYQDQDKKAIISLGTLFGMRLVDEDIETYFGMFTPDMLADHMTKITKEQREWKLR